MTSLLLAIDATQIILIVFIVVLLIAYPIMMYSRNKKENQRMQEQTNSLKRGDKVLTTSGVYGTIVDLHQDGEKRIVTIETGTDDKKGYLSVDAYAIYSIFREEEQQADAEQTEKPASDSEVTSASETEKVEEVEEKQKDDAQTEDMEKENTPKKRSKKGKKE